MKIEMEKCLIFKIGNQFIFQLNLELGSQFYLCVSEITTRTGIKINFFFIGEIFSKKHFHFSHFFFVKGNLNILLLF
jgi:hypothetical protein